MFEESQAVRNLMLYIQVGVIRIGIDPSDPKSYIQHVNNPRCEDIREAKRWLLLQRNLINNLIV